MEEDRVPRLTRSLGKIEGLVKAEGGRFCGAKVKVAKKKAISNIGYKLYTGESMTESVNFLEKKERIKKEK